MTRDKKLFFILLLIVFLFQSFSFSARASSIEYSFYRRLDLDLRPELRKRKILNYSPLVIQVSDLRKTIFFNPSIQLSKNLLAKGLPFTTKRAYEKSSLIFETIEEIENKNNLFVIAAKLKPISQNSDFRILSKFEAQRIDFFLLFAQDFSIIDNEFDYFEFVDNFLHSKPFRDVYLLLVFRENDLSKTCVFRFSFNSEELKTLVEDSKKLFFDLERAKNETEIENLVSIARKNKLSFQTLRSFDNKDEILFVYRAYALEFSPDLLRSIYLSKIDSKTVRAKFLQYLIEKRKARQKIIEKNKKKNLSPEMIEISSDKWPNLHFLYSFILKENEDQNFRLSEINSAFYARPIVVKESKSIYLLINLMSFREGKSLFLAKREFSYRNLDRLNVKKVVDATLIKIGSMFQKPLLKKLLPSDVVVGPIFVLEKSDFYDIHFWQLIPLPTQRVISLSELEALATND